MYPRLRMIIPLCLVSLVIMGLGTSAHADWYEVYFSQVNNNAKKAKAHPNSIDRIFEQRLSHAKTSIDAALHEIDSDRIAGALIQAQERGIKVRIVTEYDYIEEPSIEDLQEGGIPIVHDEDRGGLMHNKFIVVDGRYVWAGSFNTTDNGAYKNNNNAIWIDSPELAENYTTEFNVRPVGRKEAAASGQTARLRLTFNLVTSLVHLIVTYNEQLIEIRILIMLKGVWNRPSAFLLAHGTRHTADITG